MHQKSDRIILGILLISWTVIVASAQSISPVGFRDYVNVEEDHDAKYKNGLTIQRSLPHDAAIRRDSVSQNSFYHKGNLNCQCGVGKNLNRYFQKPLIVGGNPFVVGGNISNIADIPWTVHLYKIGFFGGRKPYCGGTLINNRYVVTAGHCVHGRSSRRMEVVLNEQNSTYFGRTSGQTFKVSNIFVHPEYRSSFSNPDNDIALLRLSKPVELEGDSPIAPACVPINNEDDFAGKLASAAGWGSTMEGSDQSDTLLNVTVSVISNDKCMSKNYKGQITENMICAGDFDNGGVDACQGDSGGPLITEVQNRQLLIGVTSWGKGCGRPNYPGVYARVSRYPEWILSHTEDAEWCG